MGFLVYACCVVPLAVKLGRELFVFRFLIYERGSNLTYMHLRIPVRTDIGSKL